MKQFNVGDKVKRVTGDAGYYNEVSDHMIEGNTYTVTKQEDDCLWLAETSQKFSYLSDYFVLVEGVKSLKVGDKVKLNPKSGYYNRHFSGVQLAPDEVGIVSEVKASGWIRVNNLNGVTINSYEEHDLLLVEETPTETEVDLVPKHIAEYIEHLELREEALEGLVKGLYRDLNEATSIIKELESHLILEDATSIKQRAGAFSKLHPIIKSFKGYKHMDSSKYTFSEELQINLQNMVDTLNKAKAMEDLFNAIIK